MLYIGMNKDQKRDQIQCIHEFMQTAENKLGRNRLTNFGYFALALKSKGSKSLFQLLSEPHKIVAVAHCVHSDQCCQYQHLSSSDEMHLTAPLFMPPIGDFFLLLLYIKEAKPN